MSYPSIQTALNGGELSPDLFGRTDLEKYRKSCSTLRNFFASYRGGANSRAGTKFIGITKQGNQGTANLVLPPRLVQFQFSATQGYVIEFGANYARFITNGAYITETPVAIAGISGATVTAANSYVDGDEVYLSGIQGMVNLNNRSFLVNDATGTDFEIVSTLTGNPVSTSSYPPYTGGGTAARIYTIATPYTADQVPLLKFTQSADVMSICNPSYPPYDLVRIDASNWTLTQTSFATKIGAPPSILVTQSCATTVLQFHYQFVATAIDSNGNESIASPLGTVVSCDQSLIAGSIEITCGTVVNATSYNFYSGPIVFNQDVSPGSGLFGFVGSSPGPGFVDTNVVADFTATPPIHNNPFATSSATVFSITSEGSSYNPTQTFAQLHSPIGDDAIIFPVVQNGAVVWITNQYGGSGYTGGELVYIIDGSSSGSGAAATFTVGPATGTYPSCVAYFQQRRFYANTNNNPDTYFASRPGAFTNFDSSIPTIDSDSIVGSPWSQQVNGIQWMINMPGGLVILTGLGAWQLSGGSGGFAVANAVTPQDQVANPQAYNGVSPLVPPIVINYDILYVQERGSIVRNLSYNYFVNIYTGTDMTVLSNHLFTGYTISQWAWSEEPWKLIWAVRNDGIMLCMTFLKEQEVFAWSRHDTNGLFQSVCSVSEPPVNATYVVVKRLIQSDGGGPVWVYMAERMDDRLWIVMEDAWCVDCGLQTTLNYPSATITLTSAQGASTLQQPVVVYGGSNYSTSTYVELIDPNGTGASINLTISGGVITGASVVGVLTGYTDPTLTIIDPTGSGRGATINIQTLLVTLLVANNPVFFNSPGNGAVGDIVRMNTQIMTVLQMSSAHALLCSIDQQFVQTIPNDPLMTTIPAVAGSWSIAAPVTELFGLDHLEGMRVSILADGNVEAPQVVRNGSITLAYPATLVTVGLGYTCQLQTMYLDFPGPATIQGRRKEIDQVSVRLDHTGWPFQVGVNQPDASLQPSQNNVPWTNMTTQDGPLNGVSPLQPYNMFTGDLWGNVTDQLGFDQGQIAIQQPNPLPINVTAIVNWARVGDDPDDGS